MLIALSALVVLQIVTVVVLLLSRRSSGPATGEAAAAERMAAESAAQAAVHLGALKDLMTRMDARSETLDAHVRGAVEGIRRDLADEAQTSRESQTVAFTALRGEIASSITTLGATLQTGLEGFRADNKSSAETLRGAVERSLEGISQRLAHFVSEANQAQRQDSEALRVRLKELADGTAAQQERLRGTVEERLEKLNQANTAKLEEMRVTVDEKLHATLQTRLTESFGQVTTHLGEVQKGLGEMKELATGVGDLKKVLSNVKSRGVVGEFQLGQQLEQMFSPEQYVRNARIKANTQETVEYALKFPAGAPGSHVLLAIDAKFPKEDWERLEHAYEHGSTEEIAAAGRLFERAIRTEAKRISDKYIDPPMTMPHAVMFLPTENLYAEVVRRPGLLSDVQANCRVTVAGPSTFMAILTSFQMGFHTLAIQKKGDEVWRVLSKAKTEFSTFGGLMDKVERQVGTVQNTLKEISGKTTTINRALKNVSSLDAGRDSGADTGLDAGLGTGGASRQGLPAAKASSQSAGQERGTLLDFGELAGTSPLLAASADDR